MPGRSAGSLGARVISLMRIRCSFKASSLGGASWLTTIQIMPSGVAPAVATGLAVHFHVAKSFCMVDVVGTLEGVQVVRFPSLLSHEDILAEKCLVKCFSICCVGAGSISVTCSGNADDGRM